jgi:hydroxymethylglutaryl-CoA lyase
MTRLFINEVAPRDGLQTEKRFVPTHEKISFVDALSDCGFAKIEVSSFASPGAIPALADAQIVLREIRRVPGVAYTAQVPDLRGMERAIDSRVDELNLAMSCSESHNVASHGRGRARSLAQALRIVREAGHAGVLCNVSLSAAFGCPFEGEVPVDEVARLALVLMAGGAASITLCDNAGMADPASVRRLLERMRGVLPVAATTIRLHDARGMALANALAALEAGAARFDASCGGLGGCPGAPGASGNASTETLVHMFECMGHATGVNLARLLRVAARVPALVERPLVNALLTAGTREPLHPLPAS